jgi:hypothetical protein
MPRLKEHIWTLGTRPRLDEALARSPYDFEDMSSQVQVWTAYLPSDPPKIVSCTRCREDESGFPALSVHLRRHEPEVLLDYLFALDTYRQSRIRQEAPPGSEGFDFSPDPVVDQILAQSEGTLLWQFQLEWLAQSLGLGRPEAQEFRRHVNQKRRSALQPVSERRFPSGQSLKEVIGERLLYEGVLPGQWKGASLLFEESQI